MPRSMEEANMRWKKVVLSFVITLAIAAVVAAIVIWPFPMALIVIGALFCLVWLFVYVEFMRG